MEIKYDLVLNSMTLAAVDESEYNTIGAFQTSNSNIPNYYIIRWKVNSYTIEEQYSCNEFDPPVIIHEGMRE